MAVRVVSESAKLLSKVNNGRYWIVIVIVIIVVLPSSRLDALSVGKDVKRDADSGRPPCQRNPKIGIPVDLQLSPNKINVALTYSEIDFPFRPFNLMLYEGDSTLNCSDVSCSRHADEWRSVSGKSSVYDDLKPGYYCALLSYQHPEQENYVCYYMSSTERVTGPDNDANIDVRDNPPQKWIYVVLGICISTVAFVAVVLVWCCSRPEGIPVNSIPGMNQKSLLEAIKTENPVPIFLLYNSDCSHHMNVIRKLAEFLEQNFCKVSCEYKEKHEIVVNKVNWIHEKLSGKFKILIVNSKIAYVKQKLWLNYRNSREIKSLSDDMFLHALAIISHRIKQMVDYKNLFMLLPGYISKDYVLSDICPGKHYEFPRYLAVLLCHLHDVDPRSVDFEEPGMSWAHCAAEYDELRRQVNSMTVYDDQGNLITGCKQCDVQVIGTKLNNNLIHM